MFRRRRQAPEAEAAPKYHTLIAWESGQVRAAVVQVEQGTAQLLGVAGAPVHGISRTSHPDLDRWLAGCEKALTQAEEMTRSCCPRKVIPDEVTMGVPAEITESLPLVVSRRRSEPKNAVTLEELRSLSQRGYRQAQDLLHAAPSSPSRDLIWGTVAQILLDGQPVTDPLGLRAEQVELRLHFATAPLEWLRTLEIIAQRLQLRLLGLVPQQMALAATLSEPAALLIVVDEHYSSLSLVRHGRVESSALVELGEREIIAATAEALNLHGRQADALMRAYRAQQLREEVEAQLARAFWVELRRWMQALAQKAKEAARNAPVPDRVYLLDLTRRLPEALLSLRTAFWQEQVGTARRPQVTDWSEGAVRNVLDCTGQAAEVNLLPLRALAYYVAEVYGPGGDLDRALLETIR
jgi:cell division protein FtsA